MNFEKSNVYNMQQRSYIKHFMHVSRKSQEALGYKWTYQQMKKKNTAVEKTKQYSGLKIIIIALMITHH